MARELLPGEIEGWRAWLVVGPPRIPRLLSPSYPGQPLERLWPTSGYYEARCSKPHASSKDDPVPGEGCACGVYAALSWEELVRLGYAAATGYVVVGRVGLSGRVIRGARAHRAEKARVVELFVPFERWRWLEPLGVAYGVPASLVHVEKPEIYYETEVRR